MQVRHFGLNCGLWSNLLICQVGIKYNLVPWHHFFWMSWLRWSFCIGPHTNMWACKSAHMFMWELTCFFEMDETRQPGKCVNENKKCEKLWEKVDPPEKMCDISVPFNHQQIRWKSRTERQTSFFSSLTWNVTLEDQRDAKADHLILDPRGIPLGMSNFWSAPSIIVGVSKSHIETF
jgi:hypothetical protein